MVDHALELVDRPVELVVHDDVVEITGLLQLAAGDLEALLDHSARLGCPRSQAALKLVEGWDRDEDGHSARNRVADRPRALGLELEDTASALVEDALDLGPKRAVATGDVDHVLEELVPFRPLEELFLAEEVVLAPFGLALATRPCRRRDGQLEVGAALEQSLDERALSGPRRTGDDEELQRRRRPTSSARWRSERPPTVLDWLIRHWFRKRAALTRPNFGTAMSMSKTLAVST